MYFFNQNFQALYNQHKYDANHIQNSMKQGFKQGATPKWRL